MFTATGLPDVRSNGMAAWVTRTTPTTLVPDTARAISAVTPGRGRLRDVLLDPAGQSLYPRGEDATASLVAGFRESAGTEYRRPRFIELAGGLSLASPRPTRTAPPRRPADPQAVPPAFAATGRSWCLRPGRRARGAPSPRRPRRSRRRTAPQRRGSAAAGWC